MRIHISEATELIFINSLGQKISRPVCPDCVRHKQGETHLVHDCKTIFIDNNRNSVGQCCCYSVEHGERTK